MKILIAASEAVPFVATGGLADVIGSLPRALKSHHIDCRVVLPLYSSISSELRGGMKFLTSLEVPVSWRKQYCGIFETSVNGITYYLLDNEYYFKREGIYGQYDDAERFAFFSRAVLEMVEHIDFQPDILHANDWHTALVPAFLKIFYGGREPYSRIKSILTIHNIQYQGVYGMELVKEILGVPKEHYGVFEYNGDANFLKAGIVTADSVTTVSPTYAQELRDPYFAYGMDPIFNSIADRLCGILNGIDTSAYNPRTDANIFQKYTADDPAGKKENRRSLQKLLGLPEDESVLLIAMVGRLVEDKGLDLLRFAMEELLSHRIQLVMLGKGDWKYEGCFTEFAKRYPGKLAVRIGFINDLAHKIYAGADALLMPSKTEPCGLAQMVAMRYGTVPVVHEIGGLKDSVTDCGLGEGNGFTFQTFNAGDMLSAISRAETLFQDHDAWQALVKYDMERDFSWKKSAKSYCRLYQSLLG